MRYVVIFAAACGASPAPPAPPPQRQQLIEPPVETSEIRYDPDCVSTFNADPTNYKPQPELAATVNARTAELAAYARDTTAEQDIVDSTIETIRQARTALILDAYNPELTLTLALAYDSAFRKGCAMALLERLDALARDPRFAKQTSKVLDVIVGQPSMFASYRRDALAAINRISSPPPAPVP
ncbi:MAG: hypothetical protein ABI867_22305 [Kofleriaceae bacterium]